MSSTELTTKSQRMALAHVVQELHTKFKGVFGQETITRWLISSATTSSIGRATWILHEETRFAERS
jgi:hypothetical protein